MTIKVIKYVEGETYDIKKPETLPAQSIEVNKKDETVADFEKKVAELYDIPVERLVMLLRHNSFNNSIRIEIYNMPWRR